MCALEKPQLRAAASIIETMNFGRNVRLERLRRIDCDCESANLVKAGMGTIEIP
jgi:hypothetical protein